MEKGYGEMNIDDLNRVDEARVIVNSIRDNLIFLGTSNIDQMPNTVFVVLEVASDKVLSLLDEVSANKGNKKI